MFRNQYIEWDVEDYQAGIPVGYEAFLSVYQGSFPHYLVTTYEEASKCYPNTFYYSLDDGTTWTAFPLGENGHTFNQAYKIRLKINNIRSGIIWGHKNNTLYQISPDCRSNIQSLALNTSKLEANDNGVYFIGNQTLNKLDINEVDGTRLSYSLFSVNLGNKCLSFSVDRQRKSFWQIDNDKVYLRDFYGNIIIDYTLPFVIDEDYSSSSISSLSSIDSSSLSSTSSISSSNSTQTVSVSSKSNSSSSSQTVSFSSSSTSSEIESRSTLSSLSTNSNSSSSVSDISSSSRSSHSTSSTSSSS